MYKISVLVPCCNVEAYVRVCLESIRRQTYRNLEVLCVDDGSTDGTGAIIDEYAEKDSRFIAIHKPNSGYGDSMNLALNRSTGEYIGIVESDDWIESDMFKTLLTAAVSNNLDHVRCLWYEGPTATERVRRWRDVPKNRVFCPLQQLEIFLIQPAIWSALYRRDLLDAPQGKVRFLPTPGASYQDASFAFKTYAGSQRMMMIDRPLYHYRINPGSSVSSPGKVLCLLDEWKEEERWLMAHLTEREILIRHQTFARVVYGGFRWNYNRISLEQKHDFIEACSPLFRRFVEEELFDASWLKGSRWGDRLLLTIHQPEIFYQYFVQRERRRAFWHRVLSWFGI